MKIEELVIEFSAGPIWEKHRTSSNFVRQQPLNLRWLRLCCINKQISMIKKRENYPFSQSLVLFQIIIYFIQNCGAMIRQDYGFLPLRIASKLGGVECTSNEATHRKKIDDPISGRIGIQGFY